MADTPVVSAQRRPRPWWVMLFIVFLAICLVFLAVVLIYDATGRADLNRALAEARADGGPVTLAEIEAARKVWPAEANGALVILKLADRLAQIEAEAKKDKLPILDYNIPLRPGDVLAGEWDEATDRVVAKRLQEWAPELAQIDRLRDYQGGRFPLTYEPCPFATDCQHLSALRTSASLKSLQVLYHSRHGQAGDVAGDLGTLFRHASLLEDEPSLIPALTATHLNRLATDTLVDVCGHVAFQASQLVQLDKLLLLAGQADLLPGGIRGERAFFIATADRYREGGDFGCFELPLRKLNPMRPFMRGWVMRDEAVGIRLDTLELKGNACEDDFVKVADVSVLNSDEFGRRYPLTSLFLPSLERARGLVNAGLAENRCARIVLAANRYRIDHGEFPVALDKLIPEYLDRLPVDPFDKKPLRYRPADGSMAVYSVGWDLKDNGGRLHEPPPGTDERDFGFRLLPPGRRGLAPATMPVQAAPGKNVP